MANDTKTSQLTQTAITAGCIIEISIPDGGGGWLSRKIDYSDFLATLNTYTSQSIQTSKDKSKSAAFTKVFNADTKIESIDFVWVSGSSVIITVGTAALGTDIISTRTITSIKNSFNPLADARTYFTGSTTLYFTISGGAVDVITNYRNNYNS